MVSANFDRLDEGLSVFVGADRNMEDEPRLAEDMVDMMAWCVVW